MQQYKDLFFNLVYPSQNRFKFKLLITYNIKLEYYKVEVLK